MNQSWVECAEAGNIDEAIMEIVRTYDYVSFVELERKLAPYIETKGNHALELAPKTNIFIWFGLSEVLSDAILRLLRTKRIEPKATSLLVYMVDGATPKVPIAKRPPKNGYKSERWCPVVLRIAGL